jgi:hypothetical protein
MRVAVRSPPPGSSRWSDDLHSAGARMMSSVALVKNHCLHRGKPGGGPVVCLRCSAESRLHWDKPSGGQRRTTGSDLASLPDLASGTFRCHWSCNVLRVLRHVPVRDEELVRCRGVWNRNAHRAIRAHSTKPNLSDRRHPEPRENKGTGPFIRESKMDLSLFSMRPSAATKGKAEK